MIRYPAIMFTTMGITAPSSGVGPEQHSLLEQAIARQQEKGFKVVTGDTAWTQEFAKSAPAKKRADEFMDMMNNTDIDFIFPPWGGELLIEILEYLDFSKIQPKWVLGYSDLSLLLLAITLKTGIATAHGTNIVDLRGKTSDETTDRWLSVLKTGQGETIAQSSSKYYQKQWNHAEPSPVVFHLTEPTEWKTVSGSSETFSGRLLGGCIDVIRHLIGTPYGEVRAFRDEHIPEEPVIWYLENCEMSVADLKRSLTGMKYAGWFENCAGILFGRSGANEPVEGYTVEMMYQDLAEDLSLPIAYDIDLGHVPPQITFVNGAHAEIQVAEGKGTVIQEFR
ncbi:LD-carboxypeptidase [Planococcus sp. CPCC 101016]|uniref:S66 family peptidase n=1 Tax=Planococcus sp. CPCC 101016 TaxID=2599617 RepID=UPI0011B55283|nr:S66 peptidase family protein [Planococcus sp. CPCC 101016]TWT07733.1 LD-carboxypeptidase [Planococcus sp. CPCC 101016]